MNVLAINDYLHMGGAEVLMHSTATGLRQRGHHVELFTIESVPGHRRTAASYIHNARACRALRQTIAKVRPDVIHLHNFYHELSPAILGVIAAWKAVRSQHHAFCRVVMTAHDFNLVCPSPGLTEFRDGHRISLTPERVPISPLQLVLCNWDDRSRFRSLLRVTQRAWNYALHRRLSSIDLVLCPSEFLASVLSRAKLPVAVLSNPAPSLAVLSEQDRLCGPGTVLSLLFAGRLEPEKGLSEFLRLVPLDQRWTLDVIGQGRDLDTCINVIQSRPGLAGRVRMLGRLPREATLAVMGQAHALLLPSLWHENQPTVMLEALSRGASLLVAGGGGMREIVQGSGVGEVFQMDAYSIGAAIGRLAASLHRGSLNTFDVSQYLKDRGTDRYLDQLINHLAPTIDNQRDVAT